MAKRIVIALGGNALGNTPYEQLALVTETAKPIVDLIEQGNEVIIAHGNGPQVGMINLGMATAAEAGAIKSDMPFPECGAMSQGYIGYHQQNAIGNELAARRIHKDVATVVKGFRIAFISDLHYKSLLKEKGLNDLVRLLIAQKADVLLMGGDYQEGCEYVDPLFSALARVKTPMGIYGVMGNNDYERCHDEIIRTMKHYGMHPLEHEVDTLRKDGQQIIIAGVRNPFDLGQNGKSPTLALSPRDFVIMLVHTPDYVEDVSVVNTDLALAGHTHGGQVCVFGIAPVLNSNYGTRFLTGLACNSAKIPLIVTNGIGTSQLPIRIGAPAEVIMITLHRLKE